MSFIIGRGRTARETYPEGPAGGGGVTPAFGVAYGASSTVIGADSAVTFDLGATPYPNTGFTSVPSPGGSAFVVATSGDYEFDFYVNGTHPAEATVPLVFELYVNGSTVSRNYQFTGALNPTLQQTVVGHGIIALTAGQSVTLHNRTNTVTDAVTVTNPAATGSDAGSCNRMFALNRIG
jgi:phage gp45-like